MGVSAEINGGQYFIGSNRYFCRENLCNNNSTDMIAELENQGNTVVILGGKKEGLMGLFVVADTLRDEAAKAVNESREHGISRIIMLTGDNDNTAKSVAGKLGIEYQAGLLPGEKLGAIEELKSTGRKVAMIGDGINDAPALAVSSVGVAMGAAGATLPLR